MLITVIVPTLNEAVALPGALEHVGALEGSWEVIVADGGSADGTWPRPVALVGSTRAGRSSRPRAPDECGRRVGPGTRADLSHADTRLAADAHARVAGALAAGAQGGNFTLRFEDRRWRLQSLLDVGVRATAPHRLLLRRLGDLAAHRSVPRAAAPPVCLPGPAVTNPRRWRAWGVGRTWRRGWRFGCSTRSECHPRGWRAFTRMSAEGTPREAPARCSPPRCFAGATGD